MSSTMATTLIFTYVAILAALLIFDLRQRRILNVILLPALLLAMGAAAIGGQQTFLLSLWGAAAGFVFFFLLYWVGSGLYGREALGFGDVKLAMLMGAMLGLKYVWPALILGILSAGLASLFLYLSGRVALDGGLPYGAFMASAGIMVLIWTGI